MTPNENHREETVLDSIERLLLSLGMDSEHDGFQKAAALLRVLTADVAQATE